MVFLAYGWELLTYNFILLKIVRSVVEKLGSERISKIKIVGNEEVERSLYGQFVLGKGISSGVDEQLATEARKAGRIFIQSSHASFRTTISFFASELWVLKAVFLCLGQFLLKNKR